jgi:hypothetical protein
LATTKIHFVLLAVLTPLIGCSEHNPEGGSPAADASTDRAGTTIDATSEGFHDVASEAAQPASCASAPGAIVVTTTTVTDAADGQCDLVEAMRAANTGAAVHGDCPAAVGMNQVVLAPGGVYPISAPLRIEATAEIKVCAEGGATIVAGANWMSDSSDPWASCAVFATGQTTVAKLTDITLTQAAGADLTGACVGLGDLQIRRAHVTGFSRGGVMSDCRPETGCDHENLSQGATLELFNTLVDANHSAGDGGGISILGHGSSLIVEHSSIVNNVAAGSGGALFYGGGWNNPRISNSTLSGNSAQTGGAISVKFIPCTDSYLYIFNSTIANNTAATSGGGIEFRANAGTSEGSDCFGQDVNVYSSIVTNNVVVTGDETNINADWNGGHFACASSSLLYVVPGRPVPNTLPPNTPCTFDVPDARLGPLMGLGGVGNLPMHPLLSGSPAIDAAVDGAPADEQRDSWIPAIETAQPPTWMLFDRNVDGNGDGMAMSDLGPYEVNPRWQTELLAVAAKGASAHTVVTTPDGYDRGAGTNYAATAVGDFVTYALPISEAASYSIAIGVMKADGAGQFQLSVADDPGGPWMGVGAAQDDYAAMPTFGELRLDAPIAVSTPGTRYFKFTLVGKNDASKGYQLSFDYITLSKL